MKRAFLLFFGFLTLVSAVSIFSVDAASVGAETEITKTALPFDQLTDYQVLLTGNEGGVSTYSGVNNNLRLTFDASKDEVNKIIFVFDIDTSSEQKTFFVNEMVNVINTLMPQQLSDIENDVNIFQEKLSSMNEDRDQGVFNLEKIRVEVHMTNSLVNVRITK